MSTLRRQRKRATHDFLNSCGIETVNSSYSTRDKEIILQLSINQLAKHTGKNVKQVFHNLTALMWDVKARACNKSACEYDVDKLDTISEVREVSMLYAPHDHPVTNTDLNTTTNLVDNDQEPDAPTTKQAD